MAEVSPFHEAPMCDDDDPLLSAPAIGRRHFVALAAGAALAGCAAPGAESPVGGSHVHGGTSSGGATTSPLAEREVRIDTPDGKADAFFVHPREGAHPAVIVWPDIVGLRDVFRVMARNLASSGFAVLVVNPYYRAQAAPVLDGFAAWRTPEGQAKIGPLRAALTPAAITSDALALVSFLDADAAVDTKRGIGVEGYCMGGPFAVRTAAASPRVKAAASFHGAQVATDAADSPHRLLAKASASYLFAIARNDDEKEPKAKDMLRDAATEAHRRAEVVVYPAAHGFCVSDSPAWDAPQADEARKRALAIYATL